MERLNLPRSVKRVVSMSYNTTMYNYTSFYILYLYYLVTLRRKKRMKKKLMRKRRRMFCLEQSALERAGEGEEEGEGEGEEEAEGEQIGGIHITLYVHVGIYMYM